MVNPSTLNRIVENAALTSTWASRDPLASNVGFVVAEPPGDEEEGGAAPMTLSNLFSYLRLGYRVEWPANIVLTEEAVESYGEIFRFLLQLRKAVWGLEQVYLNLKGHRRGLLLTVVYEIEKKTSRQIPQVALRTRPSSAGCT